MVVLSSRPLARGGAQGWGASFKPCRRGWQEADPPPPGSVWALTFFDILTWEPYLEASYTMSDSQDSETGMKHLRFITKAFYIFDSLTGPPGPTGHTLRTTVFIKASPVADFKLQR